jgi:hypothetical protein
MNTQSITYNDRFATLPSKAKAAIAVLEDQAKVKKGYTAQDFKIMIDARSKLAALRIELDDRFIISELCPEALKDIDAIAEFESIINEIKSLI